MYDIFEFSSSRRQLEKVRHASRISLAILSQANHISNEDLESFSWLNIDRYVRLADSCIPESVRSARRNLDRLSYLGN